MKLYIAGPMTGRKHFNYPAFVEAEALLRAAGYEVESPHHNGDGDTTQSWQWYMRAGIAQLLTCDGVALLLDWEDSRGASLEYHIATALGMECGPLDQWLAQAVSA